MIKKAFFALIFLFLVSAGSVFAVKQIPGSSVGGYANVTSQGPLQHMQIVGQCDTNGTVDSAQCYTQFSFVALLNSITMGITGNLLIGNGSNGAIGSVNSLTSTLYTNPGASSVDYVQNIANNAGFPNIVKPVYAAQGFGFTSLNFVLKLWEAMRNIAYLLFAIIFIVVGLMIVLRVKVDPKTVITIQSALPKIIWALILITFSYPIAGFLIDLMYLTIGLVLYVVQLTGLYNVVQGSSIADFADKLKTANFLDIMSNLGSNAAGMNKTSVVDPINQFTSSVLKGLFQTSGLSQAGGVKVGELLGQPITTSGIADILSPLLSLYISISVFWSLLRTFFNLLTSYGTIVFSIILSPIILIGEAIPGRSAFGGWVKNLIANLLVFPLTILMIIFGIIILNTFLTNIYSSSQTFLPPLVGVPANAIGALLGYIIIMTMPHAQDLLNEWLTVKSSKSTSYWQESLPFKGTFQKGAGNVTGAISRLIPI